MPELTPSTAPQKPAGAPPEDRTARYCRRLDDYLETLPDDASRLATLEAQQLDWIARYDRFCRRVEGGEEPHWGEDATDYVCTIAAIGARKTKLSRRAA